MANELTTTEHGSNAIQRAEFLAKSDIVPKRFRGKTNNVLAIMQLAERNGMEPITLMRSAYEVNGEYGLDAKAAIAMLSASGKIIGPPRYKIEGKDLKTSSCTCTVRDAELGEDISLTLHYKTAESQGWTKNPHWRNDPRTMMRYRAAIQLIRSSYPSVLFGMYTVDELRDANTLDGSVVMRPQAKAITHEHLDLLDDVDESPEVTSEPSEEEKAEILAAETGELFDRGAETYE